MNLTSIITFPARLGYEAARTAIDIAAGVVGGAARLVGLSGEPEAVKPEAKPRERPKPATRVTKPAPKRNQRRQPTRPKATRSAPARRDGAANKRTTAQKRTAPPESADVTLTREVEIEIFREASTPKGSVNVNSADGTVWLRGRAESPEQVRELQRRALSVPGVKKVENMLHIQLPPQPEAAEPEPTAVSERRFTPAAGDEPLAAEAPDRGAAEDARSTIP